MIQNTHGAHKNTSMHDTEHTRCTQKHTCTSPSQMPPVPMGVIMVVTRRSGLGRPVKARQSSSSVCAFCKCLCVCRWRLLFGVSGNTSGEALWQMSAIRLVKLTYRNTPCGQISGEREGMQGKSVLCVCETQRGIEREQRQRASCFGWFPTVISST